MHLFSKNHTDFDDCCYDAQRFVDNFDYLQSKALSSPLESSKPEICLDVDALADVIIGKLTQQKGTVMPYRPPPMQQYSCIYYSGSHLLGNCPLKWCVYCKQMADHGSIECHYRPRVESERRIGQPSQVVPIRPQGEEPNLEVQASLPSTSLDQSTAFGKESEVVSVRYASNHEKKRSTQDSSTQTVPLPNETLESYPKIEKDQDTQTSSEPKVKAEKGTSTEAAWPKKNCYCSECGLDPSTKGLPFKASCKETACKNFIEHG